MVDPVTLRRAQLKMLDILVEIDKICTKYGIKYWIAYGTLLGAVRHKGFIPWDDDCDICMMREDYEKFVEVAQSELPDNLFLQNKKTDPYYKKSMDKIRMKYTKFVEFDETEDEKYNQGIYVDIFIYDYYRPSLVRILNVIKVIQIWKQKRKQYPKGSIERISMQLLILLPYLFYSMLMKIFVVLSIFDRKNKKFNVIGQELKSWNLKFCDKNIIFPLKRNYEFEKKFFYVPNNAHRSLHDIYGDYMKLPEVEDRQWHAKKIEI